MPRVPKPLRKDRRRLGIDVYAHPIAPAAPCPMEGVDEALAECGPRAVTKASQTQSEARAARLAEQRKGRRFGSTLRARDPLRAAETRERDFDGPYRDFVALLVCAACDPMFYDPDGLLERVIELVVSVADAPPTCRPWSDPAHSFSRGAGGGARYMFPACREHHTTGDDSHHRAGHLTYQRTHGIVPTQIAARVRKVWLDLATAVRCPDPDPLVKQYARALDVLGIVTPGGEG
jgi:hypothetical protein